MMTSTRTQTARSEPRAGHAGNQVQFNSIDEPGTYVSWDGLLIRIPDEGIKAGHSPLVEILGKEPLYVTKISDDPYVPISKARSLAADFDLEVNF